ncbi:MAG TPA: tetratricopeptide repeat protein [Cyclobacteriaceae bacterium]|nr:tetratricopeptide repeat protein [Cyclobacteriaceae bacterium]
MKRSFFITLILCSPLFLLAQQQIASLSRPDELYNDGLALMSHNQYASAEKTFIDFLAAAAPQDPRRRDAEYYSALCAVNLYHADGEKRIATFIAENPEHPRAATAYFDLAALFYQQKNYNKAINAFEKVDFPSLSNAEQSIGHFRWGYALFNQRKLPEALDQFNFMKGLGGQYGPAASYYAGYIEFNNGDYANALTDLRRAETNQSYSLIVPYMVAQVLYKQKKYDELQTYVKSLEKREGVAQAEEIALLSAEVYFSKGDYANALKGYQQYLEDKKNADKSVVYRAGVAAMNSGDTQAAISMLKNSASGADSVGAYSSYYLGTLYLKAGQKQPAVTAFDVARKFNGDKALAEESQFQFAKLSYDLGRADLAISELEKFQAAYPNSTRAIEVKEVLSHAYVNANNYNRAIEYIESLPRRGPTVDKSYQKATYLKGTELFNMERYAEAITVFEKSLQYPIDPAMAGEAHYWCAEAYSITNQYDKAIDHYAPIVSPASGASADIMLLARYGLGYAYYNAKQYDRALYNFKEFTNRAPKNNSYVADATLRLADCYYVSKSYPEALATYRKVLNMSSPDKDYAHLQSGILLGIQSKYAEAAAELDQVVRDHSSAYKEEALFRSAQLDFEQGKYAAAAAGYTKVIQGSQTSSFLPYAYAKRAASYYNLKDYNKTAADYIYVIEHYTTHPAADGVVVSLQEALNLAGRSGEFDKYFGLVKSANPDAKGLESVQYEAAKNTYFNQDYQRAVQRLSDYLAAYPNTARTTEAKYYIAESYYRLKDFPSALKTYKEIGDDNTFQMVNKVVARISELEYKNGKYENAIPAFMRLAAISTSKKDLYTAWSGLMEAHYLLAQYDSADKYANLIIEKGNINAGAVNKASLYLGKTAMARGDYETAKDEFLNTLNSAQDEYGAEAKYLMAEIFYLNKEHARCYETLVSLNRDFSAYTEWVGKSFLLLVDNYIAQGETFQARGTLKSLIDNFPLQHIKDKATEKMKQMDDAEKKAAAETKSDTVDNK